MPSPPSPFYRTRDEREICYQNKGTPLARRGRGVGGEGTLAIVPVINHDK